MERAGFGPGASSPIVLLGRGRDLGDESPVRGEQQGSCAEREGQASLGLQQGRFREDRNIRGNF